MSMRAAYQESSTSPSSFTATTTASRSGDAITFTYYYSITITTPYSTATATGDGGNSRLCVHLFFSLSHGPLRLPNYLNVSIYTTIYALAWGETTDRISCQLLLVLCPIRELCARAERCVVVARWPLWSAVLPAPALRAVAGGLRRVRPSPMHSVFAHFIMTIILDCVAAPAPCNTDGTRCPSVWRDVPEHP